MEYTLWEHYTAILKNELMPALGCTEPISVAYAAAEAAKLLGCRPTHMEIWCSGNIIKNVQGVTVPNSGGQKGVEMAAIMGALGGKADKKLEVLEGISPETVAEAKSLLGTGYCICRLVKDVSNLYIIANAFAESGSAGIEIMDKHTNITKMVKDGAVVYQNYSASGETDGLGNKKLLNVKDIFEFAQTADIEPLKEVLDNQMEMNFAISEEGLKGTYGAAVGRTLLDMYGDDIKIRAKARSAAGSDARMSGCSLPVVINSGSGNQGMAVSLPVIEYAKELDVPREKLYRALILSNLISLHQKRYIGALSAYCGAVSAATGAGAAIAYLHGGGYAKIANTIVNTVANVGGILCDGAKPSCAAKIASAVDAAIMAFHMSDNDRTFQQGEGIVGKGVEQTIKNIGHVGASGMKTTDVEILNIMLGHVHTP